MVVLKHYVSKAIYLYQVFYFVLLLPIPLVLLASYRFQNNVSKKNLISEEYNKANNLAIFKEVFQAYKRVLFFVMTTSLLYLFIAIILPNNGFYEIGSGDVVEAIKMNIGFILFSLTVSNVSIIVARFTKKYQFTLIFGLLGFLASTILIALIFGGIGNALGIETLNMDITIYSVIWSRSGNGYLIDLSNGIILFIISGFIIYILYSGDKSIIE